MDGLLQVSDDQLKDAVAKCAEIIECLKQNECSSHAELRQEMLEYYLAARGVVLMQKLVQIIKQREYAQNLDLMDTPHELASQLESWLMDYSKAWRAVSRESELFRIKEFIWQICSVLRKYHEKR